MTPDAATGRKSRRSRKSSSRYAKLQNKDEDEVELMDLNVMAQAAAFTQSEIGKGG